MGRPSKRSEDLLRLCRNRIKSAAAFRKDEGLDDLWERMLDLYRGKHFPEGGSAQDQIAVNLAFSTINVIAPSVSVSHPKVTVNASIPENGDRALIVESVINYLWRHTDVHPEFAAVVVDYLIFGFGYMKTGYRFVEEDVARSADEIEAEYGQLVQEADAAAMQDPDAAGELPTDEEIRANLSDTKLHVVEDTAFGERVDVHAIYVDPEGTTMRDIRWIAQRIVRDVIDVRNDQAYNAKARREAQPTSEMNDRYWDGAKGDKKRPEDAQRVVVWEYYDLKNGTMSVFADSGDGFLVDPVPQPYAFGHPFSMLRNYEVPGRFYPMGELEQIEAQQHELNKTRTQLMNDRKRFARKYLYNPAAFSPRARGLLESTVDGAFVPVNDDVPLSEAVIPLTQTSMDSTIYQQSEQIAADINTITGLTEYMRGGAEQSVRRTATEASIIADAANSRAAFKLARIEAFIALVSKRLIQLAQQYMTTEAVVRVVGKNGAPLWFQYDREWIRGEYDFEVEAGSTQPLNEFAKKDQALGILEALSPFLASGLVNVPELLGHVLTHGFGVKDPSRFLVSQGPAGMGAPSADGQGGEMGLPPQGPPATPQGPPAGDSGIQGVPPEILSQLLGQVPGGMGLPV